MDEFAPRLSFFFNAHNDLFQEVAKYRAARRMWARIMKDRFGATDERSMKLRFHTQTAGSSLTAQQAENNIVRTTVQALSAVLGGTQSLHTNAFDEALALPTERARASPCAPSRSSRRGRPDRHRGPAGRLLLRRVADRRRGGSRPGSTSGA